MSKKTEALWKELSDFAEELRKENEVPGIALGVSVGEEIFASGYGVTSLENPLEVTENTYFQIGSITKVFTGSLIMQLVDEGLLDLDAPIRTYLPEFKVADEEASATATVFHLLTHSCGWVGDFFYDGGKGSDAIANYVKEMAALEQMSPVGYLVSYNNSAFTLLGGIIEAVTKKSYQEALQTKLLEPLGLENSSLDPAMVMTHRFAVGHGGGEVLRPWPIPVSAFPAGGIACGILDLLKFGRFHTGNGLDEADTAVLSKEGILKMRTPAKATYGESSVGLSWFINDEGASREIAHGGGTFGQVSNLLVIPDKQMVFGIMTNSYAGGLVIAKVTNKFRELFLGETRTPVLEKPSISVAPSEYEGTYTRPMGDIVIAEVDEHLTIQFIQKPNPFMPEAPPPSPQFKIEFKGEDMFTAAEGQSGMQSEFVRDEAGKVMWLRHGGRVCRRVEG